MQSSPMAMLSIMSLDAKTLVVPEVTINLTKAEEMDIKLLLEMSDKELLIHTSTSPEHEAQSFAQGEDLDSDPAQVRAMPADSIHHFCQSFCQLLGKQG